jgi:AraC-like DNA-binding protein
MSATDQSAAPLHRFPKIHTSDREEFRHALLRTFDVSKLTTFEPGEIRARGNLARLSEISLGFSSCGPRLGTSFAECDFVRLHFALSGQSATTSAGVTTVTNDQQSCVTSSGRPLMIDHGQNYEHVFVRFPAEALLRKLTAILGAKPKQSIVFCPVLKMDSSLAQGLRELTFFLVRQLDAPKTTLPPFAIEELEHSIISTLLYATGHNYNEVLEKQVADDIPALVRRVEDLIAAAGMKKIDAQELFKETEVSARVIYRTFQRHRGYSPMAFAKMVRLRHANAKLLDADSGTTVTGVALECGFGNLGYFASQYCELFKELPSETLHRSRRAKASAQALLNL